VPVLLAALGGPPVSIAARHYGWPAGAAALLAVCATLACAGAPQRPPRTYGVTHDGRIWQAEESCVYEGFDDTKTCDAVVLEVTGGARRKVGAIRFDRLDSCCCDVGFEATGDVLFFRARSDAACPNQPRRLRAELLVE
jgi:hypothetical protein